jgi:DNA polymerase elongation subunit (family B)
MFATLGLRLSLAKRKDFEGFQSSIRQSNQPQHILCGHNAKEFDIPFLARRMIINQIPLPDKLNLFGKKPWDRIWIRWNYGSLGITSITLL